MRIGVICDYLEEGWPSMDLCGDMLLAHWPRGARVAERFRPPFRRRLARLPGVGSGRVARNADRLANRFWDYPRALRRQRDRFDRFHLVDHSYAHLLLEVGPGTAGVLCHDLDTFRCLIEPEKEPRPAWFRAMTRRILAGFRRAAVVFHTTREVRRQLETHGLVDPARLRQVPLGVAPAFAAEDPPSSPGTAELLARLGGQPFVLHVGSCIPRKRIDVVLRVVAGLRQRIPGLRLVKTGGPLTADQRTLSRSLGLDEALLVTGFQPAEAVAELCRRSALMLLPSEAEGFGLPVAEGLASGAIVVASDLATLREVGGDAVVFCPVADVEAWVGTCLRLLADPTLAPPLERRRQCGRRFSWEAHAAAVDGAYAALGWGAGSKTVLHSAGAFPNLGA